MRVAILGAGPRGDSAARYWRNKGAEVSIFEEMDEIRSSKKDYDLIVRSTKIHPREIRASTPTTTDVREFFARCPSRIIGVTGTKGTLMTTKLIARMLEEAGKRVWLGGTIDNCMLDFLPRIKAGDLAVLDLSSCQLMDLNISPHFAVCLRVNPEQRDFDWDTREYVAAKGNLFWHQQLGDVAIYDSMNDFATQISQLSIGKSVPFLNDPGALVRNSEIVIGNEVICTASELADMEPEQIENVCAAVTVVREVLGDKLEPIRRGIRGFNVERQV